MEYHNISGQNDAVNDVPLVGRHQWRGSCEDGQYHFASSLHNDGATVTLLPVTGEDRMEMETLTAWHSATDHYKSVSSALHAGVDRAVGRTIGNIAASSHDIMTCLYHYNL